MIPLRSLIFFIISSCSLLLAQKVSEQIKELNNGLELSLNFDDNDIAVSEQKYYINEASPGSPVLKSKTYFIALPPSQKLTTIVDKVNYQKLKISKVFVNPSVQQRDGKQIGLPQQLNEEYFKNAHYPPPEIEVLGYTWVRDFYCAVIKINLERYDWKTEELSFLKSVSVKFTFNLDKSYKRLETTNDPDLPELSKIILNYNQAKTFTGQRQIADSSGNWLDYNQEYVKLRIASDGLYRIDQSDLISYGVNVTSIDPNTIKIYHRGKQIPIYVSGENDNSFDANDYVEFWGHKNYGSTEYKKIVSVGSDYLNYMDRYTDTSAYWLTWNGIKGLRTRTQSVQSGGTIDTIYSHLVKLHFEKDIRLWYYDAAVPRVQLPNWQENKVWTWEVIGSSGYKEIDFVTNNIVSNSQVKTTTRLISYGSDISLNAHKNGIAVNSDLIMDTIAYNLRQTVNLYSNFSSSNLIEGVNKFKIYGLPTAAAFQQSLLDWVDVDYYQMNFAENDSLKITIPDSMTSSLKAIKISGIKSNLKNIVIYKIYPEVKKIDNAVQASGLSQITFVDTVKGGDIYILCKNNSVKHPISVLAKRFVNLRNRNRTADYIIISNKVLANSAFEYQKFISHNYNLTTELVFTDDIYDEFSYGMLSAESIRDFLRYAFYSWTSPKPTYLLLIGDANYDYKNAYTPTPPVRKENLVPSYGNPVSDVWYTIFDNDSLSTPQMIVGRIPASTNDQVFYYLSKHQKYLARQFDDWNKYYILFSGGQFNDSLQLAQIREVNQQLLDQYINVKPIGGKGVHFYKTSNPISNFGPYSSDEINSTLNKGAIMISYVGHSGTNTWDNSISKVEDLKNNYDNRFPMISDFGCSTGKFAEPDINAFASEFISTNTNGQAINYLGNSSWGYTSSSYRFPKLFYENFLRDSIYTVGKAHYLSKMKQLLDYGINDVNLVFLYCNILFGDPIVSIKIPLLPNFNISPDLISINSKTVNDSMDSVSVEFIVKNLGKVLEDPLSISINDNYLGHLIFSKNIRISSPLFESNVIIKVPVLNRSGLHSLTITLDPDNYFHEFEKADNTAEFSLTVYSSYLKTLTLDKFNNSFTKNIILINPSNIEKHPLPRIQLSLSNHLDLSGARDFIANMDTIQTRFDVSGLPKSTRYFFRFKTDNSTDWSETYSFKNYINEFNWVVDTIIDKSTFNLDNISFNDSTRSFGLINKYNSLKIISAGYFDGETGSLLFNEQETLPQTFYWGIATAQIDSINYKPSDIRYFTYYDKNATDSLINYIDKLPQGTLLAMTICSDAAQAVLGFNPGTKARKAIKALGSNFIDSVAYKESWCILGKKGAVIGSVPESYKKAYAGQAMISISKKVVLKSGSITFPIMLNKVKLKDIVISRTIPQGGELILYILGIKANGSKDTLKVPLPDSTANLENIDTKEYLGFRFCAIYRSNNQGESPSIKFIGVKFVQPAELSINFQVVLMSKDTLMQGESENLSFYVYNIGESTAYNFKVHVEVVKPDNSRETIFEQLVDSLGSEKRKLFNVSYNTASITGNKSFLITIDPDNKITELYKDNNVYSVPFYVKPNNAPASIKLTFDGTDILNGDYVSNNPEIKVELNDLSLITIADTNHVQLFLNNKRTPLSSKEISYSYSSSNPKFVLNYKPTFSDGTYTLKVLGTNATGQVIDSSGVVRQFLVSTQAQLLYVYNYPNPFANETYFTFKLTQIPDELRIKIFTISGRMIKELAVPPGNLNYDFNRIEWDGRDADGDLAANGVYLYKIIMKKGVETIQSIQKLAIVR